MPLKRVIQTTVKSSTKRESSWLQPYR